MDLLHDLSLMCLMLFVAFMVFDWGRIWWYARRHGVIRYDHGGELSPYAVPYRWEREYLGYKIWTWFIRIATWLISLWHAAIALCWAAELLLAVL